MEEITLEETKKIINKIFKQANAGFFEIDSTDSQYSGTWKYYSKFYAKVGSALLKNGEDIFSPVKNQAQITEEDYKTPIIQIPDTETFASLLQKYLQVAEKFYAEDIKRFSLYDESFREQLTLSLFTNTTNFDRHNILSFVEQRTRMLENTLKTGQFVLQQSPQFSVMARIAKNPSMLEGPYRFTPFFISEQDASSTTQTNAQSRTTQAEAKPDAFFLPTITFGIDGDKLYIYAIQAKKDKQSTPLAKKLDRHFRKVNKDVDMEDIIGQVSPNALVSLTLFLAVMKKEGIKTVVAPNFMPLRYQTNLKGEETYFQNTGKGLLDEQSLEEIVEKHNRQQFGITNKFTYTLLRYCHHFDGCQMDYDSVREQTEITLSNENTPQDNLIQDIDKMCAKGLELRETSKQK